MRQRETWAMALKVALVVAPMIAVIFGLVFIVFLDYTRDELHARANENRALFEQHAHQQLRFDRQLTIIDINNCKEVESLKEEVRALARIQYRTLPARLQALGLELTPQARRNALKDFDRINRKFKAKPGGCGTYPPRIIR